MTLPLEEVPDHLKQYVSTQDESLYTAIDHASWRYIMRVSQYFFKDHAHPKYLEGLIETGISTERIPRVSEMDEKLKKFGWRAVAVTGFIPPAPFLEFLSLSVLPIGCDMRRLENIDYTPSPDIVHEAAGHAPIIADPSYASYLHKFGEIARRAIFAKEDLEVYHAIRHLSDTKEDPRQSLDDIRKAQEGLEKALANVSYVSEASKVSRLGWWSTEYGLYKENDKYLIYGAGLLSSVGESYSCVFDDVPKVPLTIHCVDVNFDITQPQPQLFYTEDFKELEGVIDELAASMAYKLGGLPGLKIAEKAQTVTTAQLDSGLQVSGVLTQIHVNSKDTPIYLQYTGPSQLAFEDRQLEGHGPSYHVHGYGTPLGLIEGLGISPSQLNPSQLQDMGFVEGKKGVLKFESGVHVEGVLSQKREAQGKIVVLTFQDCRVTQGDKVLFQPEWGAFDMACGDKVVSVYGGAADRGSYAREGNGYTYETKPQTSNLTEDNKNLDPLYAQVREIRQKGPLKKEEEAPILKVVSQLREQFPKDWLLRLEIVEILKTSQIESSLEKELLQELSSLGQQNPQWQNLINRGLEIL